MKNSKTYGMAVKKNKALLLGGTGAMGVYLAPELANRGYDVWVVSIDYAVSDNPNISYIKANAKDNVYLEELLKEKFDVIVDFLIYGTDEFNARHEILLKNTAHYIFLSTYRIYSGVFPITENTPRLLDVSDDKDFLSTEDYALYKARQEDILQNSKYDNWTIVRPSITYSKFRYQLVTLEAHIVVGRALKGLPIVLPESALGVQGTMTWAGNTAKMFAGLVLNPLAFRECFTFATAEHHTWGEIAEYYKEIIGLKYVAASTEDYIKIMGNSPGARYQLIYDRLYERIVDNSKILHAAGMKHADFLPLRQGLENELNRLPHSMWTDSVDPIMERMDDYLRRHFNG